MLTELSTLMHLKKSPAEFKEVSCFKMFQGEMVKKAEIKTEFSQLNDKRFYFSNGIISLPCGHPSVKEIDYFEKEKGQKIEIYFWEET